MRLAKGAGPVGAAEHAAIFDRPLINIWSDRGGEVIRVLDDPGHDQFPSDGASGEDSLGGALVGMESPEEQEVFAADRVEWKAFDRDAVMDGGGIAERRVPVGVADCDIGGTVVIALEHGQD